MAHLAGLGCPVPAARAWLFLPDQLFTHFEREESLATLRGKLDDELVRIHDILKRATSNSVIVMNESFASTLNDARFIGTEMLKWIIQLHALAVYVTFVDELASLGEARARPRSIAAYAGFALPTHDPRLVLVLFALAGAGIGLAETAESTLVARLLPEQLRGSGSGVLGGLRSVCDLLASTVRSRRAPSS